MEETDDTGRLEFQRRRSKRRSSILKPPTIPAALLELDPNKPNEEDFTVNTKKSRRSTKRVSFSATCQVKEFQKDGPLKRHGIPPPADADPPNENRDNRRTSTSNQIPSLDNLLQGPLQDEVFAPAECISIGGGTAQKKDDLPKNTKPPSPNEQSARASVGLYIPPRNFTSERSAPSSVHTTTQTSSMAITSTDHVLQQHCVSKSTENTHIYHDDMGDMEMTECLSQKISFNVNQALEQIEDPTAADRTKIFSNDADMEFTACFTAQNSISVSSNKMDSLPKAPTCLSFSQPSSYVSPDNTEILVDSTTALSRIMSGGFSSGNKSVSEAKLDTPSSALTKTVAPSSTLSKTIDQKDDSLDDTGKIISSLALSRIVSGGSVRNNELSKIIDRKDESVDDSGKVDSSLFLTRIASSGPVTGALFVSGMEKTNLESSTAGNMNPKTETIDSRSFVEKLGGLTEPTMSENNQLSSLPNTSQIQLSSNVGNTTRIFHGEEDAANLDLTECMTSNFTENLTGTTEDLLAGLKSASEKTCIFDTSSNDMEFTACISSIPQAALAGVGIGVTSDAVSTSPIENKTKSESPLNETHMDNVTMEMTACLTGFPPLLSTDQGDTFKSPSMPGAWNESVGLTLGEQKKTPASDSELSGANLIRGRPRLKSSSSEIDFHKENMRPINNEPTRVGLTDITHQYKLDSESEVSKSRSRLPSGSETESDSELICPDGGVPIKMVNIGAPRITADGCIYTQATFDPSVKFLGNLASIVTPGEVNLDPIMERSHETSSAYQSIDDSKTTSNGSKREPHDQSPKIIDTIDGDMEFTACVGKILDQTKFEINKTKLASDGDTADMEFTACVGKILDQTKFEINKTKLASDGDSGDMEFTACVGQILDQTKLAINKTKLASDGDTDGMEFTTCFGKILDQTKLAINKTILASDGDSGDMEFTACVGKILDQTKFEINKTKLASDGDSGDMEFTACVGKILDQTKMAINKTKLSSDGDTDGMEFTACVGKILDQTKFEINKTKLASDGDTDGMEFTTCVGKILDQTKLAINKTILASDGDSGDMEFTACVGQILDQTKLAINKTKLASDVDSGDMEFTTCIGKILDQKKSTIKISDSQETGQSNFTTCGGKMLDQSRAEDRTKLNSDVTEITHGGGTLSKTSGALNKAKIGDTDGMEFTTSLGKILDQTKATIAQSRLTTEEEPKGMDFTMCTGGILNQTTALGNKTKLGTEGMDFTMSTGGILNQTTALGNKTKLGTEGMDFTMSTGGILNQTTAPGNKTKLGTEGMDFTMCTGGILNQTTALGNKTKLGTEGMDFTMCTGGILNQTTAPGNKTKLGTEGMDFTMCTGGILNQTTALGNKTKLGTEGMDFTMCTGGILNQTTAPGNKTKLGTEGMDFTMCTGGILNQTTAPGNKTKLGTEGMDFTMYTGGILNQTTAPGNKTKLGTEGMDFTMCTGGILNQTTAPGNKTKLGTEGMDFTMCTGGILNQTTAPGNKTKLGTEGMDFTMCTGGILNQTTAPGNKTKLGTEGMDFTMCTGGILNQTTALDNKTKLGTDDMQLSSVSKILDQTQEVMEKCESLPETMDFTSTGQNPELTRSLMNKSELPRHDALELTSGEVKIQLENELETLESSNSVASSQVQQSDLGTSLQCKSVTSQALPDDICQNKNQLDNLMTKSMYNDGDLSSREKRKLSEKESEVGYGYNSEKSLETSRLSLLKRSMIERGHTSRLDSASEIKNQTRSTSSAGTSLWGDESMELVSAFDSFSSYSKEDKTQTPEVIISSSPSNIADLSAARREETRMENLEENESRFHEEEMKEESEGEKSALRAVGTGTMKQSILRPNPSPLQGSLSHSTLSGFSILPDGEASLHSRLGLGIGHSYTSVIEISQLEDETKPVSVDDYLHMLNPVFSTYLNGNTRRSSIAPMKVKPPTSEAEILKIRFIEAPMVELLEKTITGMVQEEEMLKEAVSQLEGETMDDLPADFLEIPHATSDTKAALVKKYRNLYKTCSNYSKTVRKSRKHEFTTALNIKYQSQVQEAMKMKNEIMDKIELAAEVQQLLDQVKEDLKNQQTEMETAENEKLSGFNQKIAALQEALASKEMELDEINKLQKVTMEKEKKLHSDIEKRFIKLIPKQRPMSISKLHSLSAWSTETSTSNTHSVAFLFGTLAVQMTYNSELDGSLLTDLNISSRLGENVAQSAQFAHRYFCKKVDVDSLRENHPTRNELNDLLVDIASVVVVAANLCEDIMGASVGHKVTVDNLTVNVDFVSMSLHSKFRLILVVDPNTYPMRGCHWDLVQIIGTISEEDISDVIGNLEPGLSYIIRLVMAVDNYISKKSGRT